MIGMILRNLRIKADMYQNDVAKALGISNSSLSDYELGKSNPDFDTILRLLNHYGCTFKIETKEGELIDLEDLLRPLQ